MADLNISDDASVTFLAKMQLFLSMSKNDFELFKASFSFLVKIIPVLLFLNSLRYLFT